MLSMETKTQQSAPINQAISNAGGVNQNPTDPALGMQSQANNPGQPLALPNQSVVLPQNLQTNTSAVAQGSSDLASALPSISRLTQSSISGVTQASNLQNMPGISQRSVNNPMGQGAQTDIYANAQGQMQGRQQQQQIISQQQQQSQNPLMYQHQLQQRMLNQRMQQQQSLSLPNQLQSTKPSSMKMSYGLQSSNIQLTQAASTQSTPQTGLQQNQLNQIQQSGPSLLQSNPQSDARQQQAQSLHQHAPSLQPQSMPISQQSNLSQQQRMIGQQGNMRNMQQTELCGQRNSIGDIQKQQQRLPIQQNSLLSMQQQQQMMNEQTLALRQRQQQQLGSQSNMSGLQQQEHVLGSLTSISNMQLHQWTMLMQKNAAQQQQQQWQQQKNQQSSLTLLQSQGQQSQHQSLQQQLMSQYQTQLHQQLMMQQQSNSLQREMQQRLQGFNPLLQAQNAMEQKPFIQAQSGPPEVLSSMESTTQTGHAGVVDWQEECYQKLKAMKGQYFADLTEFHQKITLKLLQQQALIPPGTQSEQHEKLKSFRTMLEQMLALLQINKNNIPVGMKVKLPIYEKQIIYMVASKRHKKGNVPATSKTNATEQPVDGLIKVREKASDEVVAQELSSSHICTGGTEKPKEPTFSCPICMCTLVSSYSTICGHIFCEDCIRAAIKRRKECPTCRAKLTGKNNIHRVFLPTTD